MDPLSLTASIVSLLSFSGSCAKDLRKLIHTVRNAPTEILALTNELADLNVLLADVNNTSQAIERAPVQSQANSDFLNALSAQLARAESKITQLHALASSLSTRTNDGDIKFQRYIWLRKKSSAIRIQQDLAEIRQSLGLLFTSNTAARTLKIELSLHALSIDNDPGRRNSRGFQEVPGYPTVLPTIPDEVLNPNVIQGDGSHVPPEPIENTENYTPTQPLDLAGGLTKAGQFPPELSTLLQTVRQIAQFSSLTFHVHRFARCEGNCQCICHSHARFQSPKLLSQFFGALFIGYAGLPITTRQCNVDTCTNQYSRTVHMSYTFPGWFLSRTIDLVAATTYTGEPSFGVKLRNRTNNTGENNIFRYARDGNIPGIIEMFKKRKASPNDLSYGGGCSVLHFPLELGHIETCKFLLDLGVDPYFEDDNGNSPAKTVSSYILSSKETTPLAKAYESTFFGMSSSHSELWDFSYVHRVVVGIQPTDLFSTLNEPARRLEINKVDKARRTPLMWAALRGDDETVRTLLQAGADISLYDYEGRTALHAALQSPSLRCVELLLMAGSSVHKRDIHGDTALQIATWSHRPCLSDSNVPMIEALYLAGAAVNARQNKGVSAIQSAACLNRVANARFMLSIGANPNNRDNSGDVPIFECLFYNTHGMLDLLLRCPETRLDNVNNAGQSILHFAALYADVQSMEMLVESRLYGLSRGIRDNRGRSVREAFEHRTFVADTRLRAVFDKLLDKAGQENDEDEEEQFVDAAEVLSL